ncbi:ABC-three component system protein [Sulfuritalea sp.]|uniref:ABC-three component system protein n=1 Tax=Sulfuritalea sp. TaxID=2480090 RepID=UPI00286DD304|nr:ABC-three component system protein [Sulfuritalea sp.]
MNQLGNKAGRDLAGRDINNSYQLPSPRTPMTALVEQYRSEAATDQTLSSLIDKLEHWFSNSTSSDVRSLEDKLTSSGRADLLEEALARKQAAYKLIMRNQGSKTAQMIFAYLLAEIVVNFEQTVRPMIQSGVDRAQVDKAILDNVISPTLKALEDNPLMLDKVEIQSLLYFLGGNCHIRWDPC